MTFTPPSLEEIKLHGTKLGLPESESEKFWNYFCSNDWHVGRTKMKSWPHALTGWKLRWQEREARHHQRNGEVSASVKLIKDQKEFDRVEERIKVLKNRYACENVQSIAWYPKDKAEFEMLKKRKAELLKILQFSV